MYLKEESISSGQRSRLGSVWDLGDDDDCVFKTDPKSTLENLDDEKSLKVSKTDNIDFDGSILSGENQELGSDDKVDIFETDQKTRSPLASVGEDCVFLDPDQNSTQICKDSKKKAWEAQCRRNILAKNAVDAFLLEIADQIGDEDNEDVSKESQIQIPSQSFFL